MEPRPTCCQKPCQEAEGVFKKFYENVPEPQRGQMVADKFERFNQQLDNLGFDCSEKYCYILAQLIENAGENG